MKEMQGHIDKFCVVENLRVEEQPIFDSTIHTVASFHEKCDDQSATLTYVTTNIGIFAGYCNVAWPAGHAGPLVDARGVLFDQRGAHYSTSGAKCAIYCYPSKGPMWGGNCLHTGFLHGPWGDACAVTYEPHYPTWKGKGSLSVIRVVVHRVLSAGIIHHELSSICADNEENMRKSVVTLSNPFCGLCVGKDAEIVCLGSEIGRRDDDIAKLQRNVESRDKELRIAAAEVRVLRGLVSEKSAMIDKLREEVATLRLTVLKVNAELAVRTK